MFSVTSHKSKRPSLTYTHLSFTKKNKQPPRVSLNHLLLFASLQLIYLTHPLFFFFFFFFLKWKTPPKTNMTMENNYLKMYSISVSPTKNCDFSIANWAMSVYVY